MIKSIPIAPNRRASFESVHVVISCILCSIIVVKEAAAGLGVSEDPLAAIALKPGDTQQPLPTRQLNTLISRIGYRPSKTNPI
jgi:hypothetical protein